uniref:RNA cap guanine-N2 methyltransferase n=1 Tax=Mimivirus LCMiAC02 TaxID=2506609 RepID=A0A481Z2A8_9VIRU|nr:MAG: RNA cap guanine-N2 methyltransferase [Mimivirus LCMiAC02]
MQNNLCNNRKTICRLFRKIDDLSKMNKLQIDNESIHYITPKEKSSLISFIILIHLSKLKINTNNISITDTMACVGGDTISFAYVFKKVIAIEINKDRVKYLTNNINVYKLKNVDIFNDDCLKILYNIPKHNVVFIDPPWGGSGYKEHKNLTLKISNEPLEKICNNIMNEKMMTCTPELIVLKLPKNYFLQKICDEVNSTKIWKHEMDNMNIIVIINTTKLNKI